MDRDIIFGIAMIALSVSFILLQLWYCRRIHKSRKFGFGPEFASVLLILIAICDCFQLVGYIYTALQLFNKEPRLPLVRYVGGMLTCFWNVVTFCLCFFVLHRFVYVTFPFHTRILMHRRVVQAFLLFVVLYILAHMTAIVFLWDLYYFTDVYIWKVDKATSREIYALLTLITISNYMLVFFPLPFYAAIFTVLLIRRKKFSKSSTSTNLDLWAILQMFIFWLFAVFSWITWEFSPRRLGGPGYLFLRNTVLQMCWNGLKPVSYLVGSLIQPLFSRRTRILSLPVQPTDSIERKQERCVPHLPMPQIEK